MWAAFVGMRRAIGKVADERGAGQARTRLPWSVGDDAALGWLPADFGDAIDALLRFGQASRLDPLTRPPDP